MKFFSVLLLLVASIGGNSTLTPSRLDDPQSRAFHHIHYVTLLEGDSCSATAIGPHTLLTATHCEMGTDKIEMDGANYDVAQVIRDGADHTILILPGADFTAYLQIDQRAPRTNEHIRGWGWPANVPNIVYKEGSFIKAIDIDGVDIPGYLYAYPVFAGDSGGAILTDDNKVLSVVSLGDNAAHTVAFALQFTPAQVAAIR